MNWLSFKGHRTDEAPGIIVAKMPHPKKAQMRYTEYQVRGRNGALHSFEGYDTFDITCRLMLVDSNVENRQWINNWASGTGKLITSDDPIKAYNASVLREINWMRDEGYKGYWDTAEITFTCQPIIVEAIDREVTFTQSGSINNIGTIESSPLIKVNGSGNCSFAVGDYSISISGVTSGVPVYIDCENGYVYTASGAMSMTGEFPVLGLGTTTITVGSGVSSLVITPRWGWV